MGRVLDDADDPLLVLARRAGVSLRVPAGLDGMCCGLAFASKGYPGPARARTEALQAALAPLTDGGLPVVVDGSSCAHHLHGLVGTIAIEDAVRFTHRTLLPRLTVRRRIPVLALHIPCAAQHLGLEGDLRALAAAVAERVVEPARQECCGFAGDRGFTHPELTAGATAAMAESLRGTGAAAGAGSNLPCGVGMTRATGLPFRPILALLEEATR
jgi:D-lactate dehydrogenase